MRDDAVCADAGADAAVGSNQYINKVGSQATMSWILSEGNQYDKRVIHSGNQRGPQRPLSPKTVRGLQSDDGRDDRRCHVVTEGGVRSGYY